MPGMTDERGPATAVPDGPAAAAPEGSTGAPSPGAPRRSRRRLFAIIAAVLALVGIVLVVVAVAHPSTSPPPPQPAAAVANAPTASAEGGPPAPATSAAPSQVATGPVLPRSMPVELDVPAIGVHSVLLQLGANPDQTIQVPPLEKDSKAGWFTYSPTPGELGPSVLLGHVDSAQWGPGVFFRLGALKPGQQAEVTRADGTVAIFAVDRVDSYSKDAFPSLQVYGNTPDAELRLITCGGVFDRAAHNYENNIVAYAHLVGTRPA